VNAPLDTPLHAHARDCDACASEAPPLAALAAALDGDAGAVDAGRLSRLALARVAPALQARADALFWRRFARALAAGLVPLPLVIGINVWVLSWLYELAAAWLPTALAMYLVLSDALLLLVSIGCAYAMIPLLLARPIPETEATSA
jgi:hypothetical protein